MTLLKVQGQTNLFRDTNNQALISTDVGGLEEYNRRRKIMASQKEELNKVKSELDSIKNDISEIKQLMHKLIEK